MGLFCWGRKASPPAFVSLRLPPPKGAKEWFSPFGGGAAKAAGGGAFRWTKGRRFFCWGRVRICAGGFMAKIDKVKAKIDWLKELFKIVVAIMVADVAGMAKLYLDNTIDVLFYAGGLLLVVLVLFSVVISRKMEHQISELEDL
jgi:hypothetical protein